MNDIKDVSKFKDIFDGTIWILRPVYNFAGRDIKLVTKYNNYLEHIKKSDARVITEYIKDPLLTLSGKISFKNLIFNM